MAPSIGVNLRVTGQLDRGDRKYMEDFFSVAYQQTENERDLEYAFFGIFDGHGGREAAVFAKEHLMDFIVNDKRFWSDDDEDVLRAISNGYLQTHYAMWKDQVNWPKTSSGLPSTSGTTASIAFIRKGKIYIGHVGDSAIVLGYQGEGHYWSAKPLTKDHKPEDAEEESRIVRSGGKVVHKSGVPRVVWNRPRLGHKGPVRRSTPFDEIPFLAVARSLGDLWSYNSDTDEFIVSPEPEVKVIKVDVERHRCLIFGTDGLWNMLSPSNAVYLVHSAEMRNENNVINANQSSGSNNNSWINPSKRLVDAALLRWSRSGSRADNTSAVTLMLDPPGPPRRTVVLRQMQIIDHPVVGTMNDKESDPLMDDETVETLQRNPAAADADLRKASANKDLKFLEPALNPDPAASSGGVAIFTRLPSSAPSLRTSVSDSLSLPFRTHPVANMPQVTVQPLNSTESSQSFQPLSAEQSKELEKTGASCEPQPSTLSQRPLETGHCSREQPNVLLSQPHPVTSPEEPNTAQPRQQLCETPAAQIVEVSQSSQPVGVHECLQPQKSAQYTPAQKSVLQQPHNYIQPSPIHQIQKIMQAQQLCQPPLSSLAQPTMQLHKVDPPEKSSLSDGTVVQQLQPSLQTHQRQTHKLLPANISSPAPISRQNGFSYCRNSTGGVRRRHSSVLDTRTNIGRASGIIRRSLGYASANELGYEPGAKRRTRSEDKILQSVGRVDDEMRTSDEENERVAWSSKWVDKRRSSGDCSEENTARNCSFRRRRKWIRSGGNSLGRMKEARSSTCVRSSGSFLSSSVMASNRDCVEGESSRVLRSDTLAAMPVRTLRSRNVDLKSSRISLHTPAKLNSSKRTAHLKAALSVEMAFANGPTSMLQTAKLPLSSIGSGLSKRNRHTFCERSRTMTTRSRVKRLSK